MASVIQSPEITAPDAEPGKKDAKADHTELLDEARERFEQISADDKDNHDNQREDTEFVFVPGKQWQDKVRAQRTRWNELCLEFNQLKQFVKQVVNDQRQNRPGVRVHPASGDASEETAEILQGLIRNIEYDSKAEAAYDNAFQSAVTGGRGWWRIVSEYESADSFNQKLVIKPIRDGNTVWADLDYQEPDASDRRFVFIVEPVPVDEFERQYPDAEPVSWDQVDARWRGEKDVIYVADYYRRVVRKRQLVRMSDGAQGWKDELPKTLPEGIKIVAEREAEDYSVEWYKIAGGNQVLETYTWPGSIIPVVQTVGEDVTVDGARLFQGLTRHARDGQRMLNYGMTQQAIHLALTPRAPWVIAEGQIEGYEDTWRDANTRNFSYLPYKPTTVEGVMVPPPQRTAPSMPDAGWLNWTQSMTGQIRSTIGMYENSLGMRATESSGRAIIAREKQGDNATFDYVDNLSRAIALTGRILVECIPTFYDTERIVHIIGTDDQRKMVTVNQSVLDEAGALAAIKANNLSVGKYAVTVQAGPSYATKRQETSDKLMQLVQAFPPAAQVAGDLVVKALDIPDADTIAERLKLALPPAVQQMLQAKEQNGGKAPDPALMAKMTQLVQEVQQATQAAQGLAQENAQLKTGQQARMAEAQAKAQADAIIERERLANETVRAVEKARAEAQAKVEAARLDAETEIKKALISRDTELTKAQMEQQTKLLVAAGESQGDDADEGMEQVEGIGPDGSLMHEASEGEVAPDRILALVDSIQALAQGMALNHPMNMQPVRKTVAIVAPSGATYRGVIEEAR